MGSAYERRSSMTGAALGIGAGLLIAFLLLGVGVALAPALSGGAILGLLVAATRRTGRADPQRARRSLVFVFLACAVGVVAALLVLDGQSGPCNVDDFTGCSAAGELAVFASLFLLPATAALALILVILFLAQQLRSRD